MNQEERLALLETTLVRRVPGANHWQRQENPAEGVTPTPPPEYWWEIQAERSTAQRLVVLLRADGDVQVEYHLEKPGSPFEALFVLEPGREATAIEEVGRFVAELLEEQLALGYANGLWKGGRRFLKPNELSSPARSGLRWVTSWRGTYDWP